MAEPREVTQMIERMARAIYEARNGHGCTPWSRIGGGHQGPYRTDARAALASLGGPLEHLAALRAGAHVIVPVEPTRAMIDAAYAAHDAYETGESPAAWCGLSDAYRAMIAARPRPTGGSNG